MPPALLCGVWGPGPLICGDVLWREPPSVITLLPSPPPPLSLLRPRGLTHTAGRTAAPPAAQTQGAPLPAPQPLGCPLPPFPGARRVCLWDRGLSGLKTSIPTLSSSPGSQTRKGALGTRLSLRNIWTGDTPVRTRPQLWLERPATLIPERKHSTQTSIPPNPPLFLFLNHQFIYLLGRTGGREDER